MHGNRPVLLAPPDASRPAGPDNGWCGPRLGPPEQQPGWEAEFDGARLVVRDPCGAAWYDGPLAAARQWTRAVRTHRTLLIVTGDFTSAFDFPTAATAGNLLLLAIPIRLVDSN
ncbi:hypothetical protein [Streptomyces sp. TLI_171]|uniref:hypothetical protein n=1 Tax=Streptomyces sp. TLI_171 TaxID=1938859 RepID=UPI000C1A16E8|nr:hypothetical protein [Streptomyces sp. TLI_171]RKE16815.1 hypothetical protein BX266_0053 [Streptomyces sp. TLI_171]